MARRTLFWSAAGALAILLIALIYVLSRPDPVSQITEGMTLAEVTALLGESEGPIDPVCMPSRVVEYRWGLGAQRVGVEFSLLTPNDPKGPVGGTTGRVWGWTPRSLFDRMRDRLGW
jgi:hypothetical protein